MTSICPTNYIPSNISTSMEQIEMSLKKAPAQLQKFYKKKESCDLVFMYEGKQFLAHSFIVQKNIPLFSKGLLKKNGLKYIYEVPLKGNKQIFEKILSCLYGYSISIKRCQIQYAYQICKVLQIQELLKKICYDMINHFEEYEIFPLLKLASQHQITQIIELCFDQLEIQQYEPMRYNKSGLFICSQQLFKEIIKKHNLQKNSNEKYGLSCNEINRLIQQYCFINCLNDQKKQKIFDDIERNIYFTPLNKFLRNSTPRKTKSSSQIFFRNILSLPRSKIPEQSNSFQISKSKDEKANRNNEENKQDNKNIDCSPITPLTPVNNKKCQIKQKQMQKTTSVSNHSTDNISLQNRSRKESFGSTQTISDPKIIMVLSQISQNQKSICDSNSQMKEKAQSMLKKLQNQKKLSKLRRDRTKKMQNWLHQISGQMKVNTQRLIQIEKTVDSMQEIQSKKKINKKFGQVFQTSIALDLTLSTQFGMKENLHPCKI